MACGNAYSIDKDVVYGLRPNAHGIGKDAAYLLLVAEVRGWPTVNAYSIGKGRLSILAAAVRKWVYKNAARSSKELACGQ